VSKELRLYDASRHSVASNLRASRANLTYIRPWTGRAPVGSGLIRAKRKAMKRTWRPFASCPPWRVSGVLEFWKKGEREFNLFKKCCLFIRWPYNNAQSLFAIVHFSEPMADKLSWWYNNLRPFGTRLIMIAYQKERIENAICFFAAEHQKVTKKPLFQTYLYKYLAFFEFDHLKKYGHSPLGLTYRAMPRGPVPMEIYSNREKFKTPCVAFKKVGEDQYLVVSQGNPEMDYFSTTERVEMRRLIEIFADRFVDANDMSEASHQEIRAWRKAYNQKPNSIIDPGLTFEEDPKKKAAEKLTVAEETYLIVKALEEATTK
jgi:hypothetical protein